jgi:REP element-mobilizing transposase RayT
MPDHVHMLFTPHDEALKTTTRRVKGISARLINEAAGRRGSVWQREYFDRILRSDENIESVAEYICLNPVRAGLVEKSDDYPWIWRSWVEGKPPAGLPALH